MRGRSRIETALAQKPATGLGIAGEQLAAEELCRRGVRRVKPAASAVVRSRSAIFIVQGVAQASGESFDGFGEADVIHLAQERVDISGLAAAEAVVITDLRANVKAR